MAGYSYVVVDSAGKQKKGSIEADTEERAIALLKAENLIPVEITESADQRY